MCGGRTQTVTQKQEIDPVLRAHLYGGTLPASAMTGIMPAYFQGQGALASQAPNVQALYDYRAPVEETAQDVSNASRGDSGGYAGGYRGRNDDQPSGGGIFNTHQGPNLDGSAGYGAGGYTSFGDMFDGGGPGRSGDTFQGGGRLSDIANAVTGRGPEANRDRDEFKNGGLVAKFQEGGPIALGGGLIDAFPQNGGDVTPLSLAEQVYQLSVGTDLGALLPQYEVAGRTAAQQRAAELASQGIGAYEGALSEGRQAAQQGIAGLERSTGMARGAVSGAQQAVSRARGDVSGAISGLRSASEAARTAVSEAMPSRDQAMAVLDQAGMLGEGATMRYNPRTGYQEFMDPYLEDVVRQVESDIARQGQMQEDVIRGQAAQAGAFGGSRAAVAQRELGRNIADQQARMASQLRSDAFRQAQAQAQQAFESQQARQAQIAGLFGQLGQARGQLGAQFGQLGLAGAGQQAAAAGQMGQLGLGVGQLGLGAGQLGVSAAQQAAQAAQGIGALGMQQAQIGQMGQQMRTQDINTMLAIGAQEQAQRQAELDAARMNQYQQVMAPFQQTAFRADILSGAPTGITSTMVQPGPNPITQLGGLYLAGRGAGII